MAYTSPRVWTVGEGLTAAKLQAVSDNITYLKSQTDMIYVAVYNNDGSTLNQYDAVIIDPSYTSGLAVKTSTVVGDMRAFGVVISASISSHSTGIVAFGRLITQINVNGAVVFGHSLIIGANAHYAQDSGGGGTGYGVIGFALAANASGNATIAVLLNPNPLYFSLATSVGHSPSNNNESTSSGTTQAIASVVSDGSNRLMLLWEDMTIGASAFIFNGQNFTLFQAGGTTPALPFAWIIPNAFTGDITGTHGAVRSGGCCAALLLNGVNQSTPTRTYAAANGVSTAVAVTIPTSPGDMVFAAFTTGPVGYSISGRATGQGNLIDIQGSIPSRLVVDSAIATGANFTFTWTLSLSETWQAAGVATISI